MWRRQHWSSTSESKREEGGQHSYCHFKFGGVGSGEGLVIVGTIIVFVLVRMLIN